MNGLAYYPEVHGAIGDGVADDTTALQAWLNAAKTNPVNLQLRRGKTYRVTNILDCVDQYGLSINGNFATIFFDCYGAGSFGLFKVRRTTKQAITAQDGILGSTRNLNQYISIKNLRIEGPWRYGDSYLAYSTVATAPDGLLRSGGGNATFGRNLFTKTTLNEYTTGTATFTNGSNIVSGTDTQWLANVRAGDRIRPELSSVFGTVSSVIDNTTIQLTSPYSGTSTASVVYRAGLKPMYNTGRVAVVPGTRKVYGYGTNFTTAGLQVGDAFFFNQRFRRYKIASIDSATQLTLDRDYYDFADQYIYNTGTITATNGSTSIIGVGNEFVANLVGSVVQFIGDSTYYTIASFQNSSSMTLDRAYSGTTGSKSYNIIYTRDYSVGKPYEIQRLYQYTSAGGNNRFVPKGTSSNVRLIPTDGTSAQYSFVRNTNFVGNIFRKTPTSNSDVPLDIDDVIWNSAFTYLVVGGGIALKPPTSNSNFYQVDNPTNVNNCSVTNGSTNVTGTGFNSLAATGWIVFNDEYDFYGYTRVSNTQITLSKNYTGTTRTTATGRFGPVCYLCLGDAPSFGTDIIGLGSAKHIYLDNLYLKGGGDVGIKDCRNTQYPPEGETSFALESHQHIFISNTVIDECFSAHSMTPAGGTQLHFNKIIVKCNRSFKVANQSLDAGKVTISQMDITIYDFAAGLELYSINDLTAGQINISAPYGGYAGIDIANNDSGALSDMSGIHVTTTNITGFYYPVRFLALVGKKIKNVHLDFNATDYVASCYVNSLGGTETIENCSVTIRGSQPRVGGYVANFQLAPIKSSTFDFTQVEGINPLGTTLWTFVSGTDDGKNKFIIPVDGIPVIPTTGINIKGTRLVSRNAGAGEPDEVRCLVGGTPGTWEYRGGMGIGLIPLSAFPTWAPESSAILRNDGIYQKRTGTWVKIST